MVTTSMKYATKRAWLSTQAAFLLILLVIISTSVFKHVNNTINPISQCFNPTSIEVSNGVTGDNVDVKYLRTVDCSFEGKYQVVIEDMDRDFNVCDNSEQIPYSPKPHNGPITFKLNQFVGEQCYLLPGLYRIRVVWDIIRPWHDPERVELFSNVFEITMLGPAPK